MAAWAVPPSSALMSTPNLANQSNLTLNLSSFLIPRISLGSRIGLLRLNAEEAYTFSWRAKHAKYEAFQRQPSARVRRQSEQDKRPKATYASHPGSSARKKNGNPSKTTRSKGKKKEKRHIRKKPLATPRRENCSECSTSRYTNTA